MNCDSVRLLLNGYVDGELDLVNSLEIENHLQGCAGCTSQYQLLTALHQKLSTQLPYHPAPAHLEKRVRSSLRKAYPSTPATSILSWRWLAPAAVLAAVLF